MCVRPTFLLRHTCAPLATTPALTPSAESVNVICRETGTIILDLSNFQLKADDVIAIARMINVRTRLTALNLSHNNVEEPGMGCLCAALKSNSVLTKLDLSWASIDDESLSAIADVLSVNATLTTLQFLQIRSLQQVWNSYATR